MVQVLPQVQGWKSMTMTCPTCSQPTDRDAEAIIQARIATRPYAGPAQARHIGRLERALTEANRWIAAKCTIAGCWKSKYEALAAMDRKAK